MKNLIQQGLALRELLRVRILVLDGAMGTMLQQENLSAADFGGPQLEGCNENLVLTRPDVVQKIHRKYLEAGADVIETNTFGSTPIVLAEYGLAERAREISRRAAELASEAAFEFSKSSKPRFVAGSMGPTTKAISVTGGVTFDQLRESYYEQAAGLVEGGADILLLETCQDTRNIKAGVLGIQQLSREIGQPIPLMISVTIEPMGTMLAGQSIEALWASLDHVDVLSLGLNCATGPEFMTDHFRTLHSLTSRFVSCYPNAGLPNEEGHYRETPTSLAEQLSRFVDRGWLNIVGGCCGTTEHHIRAIAQMAEGKTPRVPTGASHRAVYSGTEIIEAEDSTRPLVVGERTNVIGSRLFKKLVAEEQWEEATEIARRQVKSGAHIVDVCLQSTDRDERSDIPPFFDQLIRKIKVPIMIDTTDARSIELALTYCQGKSIINSVNLEDGEEKFERVCPLARSYGAALVVGCIDEDPVQAQAFTRERKLEIATRSFQLLTEKYGIRSENIVFDPLVFPCATGDENYIGGAVETIEGIRLIKEAMPQVRTVLGISNVSFGLPPGAREVVNSVFLYYCTKAGLDLAIVNAERIERFGTIPEHERALAENLLYNRAPENAPDTHPQAALLHNAPADWRAQTREQKAAINQFHIAAISEHFRSAGTRKKEKAADLPLDQRLANYILEGSKDGLIADLDTKLAEGVAPLDVINGPLMAGMAEVGRLFNNNELIVAEVLQSAEAMKAAVNHLERSMEKSDIEKRGKIVLATVKGDVHDIGKNLVEIILKNNGYDVINLGIKVPPENLIQAHRDHRPDAIGLSGLLVKSAQQMVTTAADLREAGIRVPLLVGGAALSEKFTRLKIAPQYSTAVCYAKDAMAGLRLMNELSDPALRDAVLRENTHAAVGLAEEPALERAAPSAPAGEHRSPRVRADFPVPPVADLDRKVRPVRDLQEIWSYVNPQMLFGRHLGFRGNFEKALAERDPRALELSFNMDEVKREASGFMKISAVWQFFEAERHGNSIALYAPGAALPLHSFHFRRQSAGDNLCLSDYVLPPGSGGRDHLALFVVTAGAGVRERAEAAKAAGSYFYSHGLQALAIETAEACAEWLHRRIREDWGFPDPPDMTMADRFTSRYRGKRYSFGYPACPNLDDQAGIWMLLRPEEIGVHLTEGMMMDPEASVSALVFHHPDCTYFSVGDSPES
ncbi:MAG TPA: methionine synthase [Candidatus Limnocylindrales bacterium]|nr:methionine synthase [Candidatus Limnocylindrales bacterium]